MIVVLLDMGVPMIFPAMFLMILALGPVVFIEAFALRSLELSLERTVVSAAAANFASTIVGIPLTWALLYGLQAATGFISLPPGSFADNLLGITLRAPWVQATGPEFQWMLYGAGIFLLIPFFFASWFIEYWVVKKIAARELSKIPGAPSKISRAVRNANLYSYAALSIFIFILLIIHLR
jgi:hypothetical protein